MGSIYLQSVVAMLNHFIFQNLAGDLILLCLQENEVCAIQWKTSKILKTWSNFNTLLTDDFVGTGTNQVLLFSGIELF